MAGSPGNYSARLTKIPPDKGSFPLDHENECKTFMVDYLKCLKNSKFNNEDCQVFSKEYLKCRMDKGLMAKDDWKNLGLEEIVRNHGNK